MGFQGSGRGLHVEKDPDEIQDFVLDFSLWLVDDTLQTVNATATGVTLDMATINAVETTVREEGYDRVIAPLKAVVVWLSGGSVGGEGKVQVQVNTVGGRRRDVSFRVLPRNQ